MMSVLRVMMRPYKAQTLVEVIFVVGRIVIGVTKLSHDALFGVYRVAFVVIGRHFFGGC